MTQRPPAPRHLARCLCLRGRPRTRWATAGLVLAAAALAAACGSTSARSSGGGSTTAPPSSPGTAAAGSGTTEVHAARVPGVGTVMVDGAGHTLYLFSPDRQHSVTCTGGCTTVWPPLTTTATPKAGGGAQASMLGTLKEPDGRMVVTYNHWPLYTYSGDSAFGQAHGQGIMSFGGTWSAVTAAGQAAGSAHATPSTTSSYGAGY